MKNKNNHVFKFQKFRFGADFRRKSDAVCHFYRIFTIFCLQNAKYRAECREIGMKFLESQGLLS